LVSDIAVERGPILNPTVKKEDSNRERPAVQRRGLLFVVSAPSGAGKTTLRRAVVPRVANLEHSVSYTTRIPRDGEVDGADYFFVSQATFQSMVEKNDFIEWAEVHGNLYGTSRSRLMQSINGGIDLLLDIDTQGATALKKNTEGVYIYVLPPSFAVLNERLSGRGSESEEEVSRRFKKSREEIWNYRQYDYVIVNAEFDVASRELEAIVLAERVRMKQINHAWVEETFINTSRS
jgi:guanylate kinase